MDKDTKFCWFTAVPFHNTSPSKIVDASLHKISSNKTRSNHGRVVTDNVGKDDLVEIYCPNGRQKEAETISKTKVTELNREFLVIKATNVFSGKHSNTRNTTEDKASDDVVILTTNDSSGITSKQNSGIETEDCYLTGLSTSSTCQNSDLPYTEFISPKGIATRRKAHLRINRPRQNSSCGKTSIVSQEFICSSTDITSSEEIATRSNDIPPTSSSSSKITESIIPFSEGMASFKESATEEISSREIIEITMKRKHAEKKGVYSSKRFQNVQGSIKTEDISFGQHLTTCDNSCYFKHHPITLSIGWSRDVKNATALNISPLSCIMGAMEFGWDPATNIPDPDAKYQIPLIHLACMFGRADVIESVISINLLPVTHHIGSTALGVFQTHFTKSLVFFDYDQKVAAFNKCSAVLAEICPNLWLPTNEQSLLLRMSFDLMEYVKKVEMSSEVISTSKNSSHQPIEAFVKMHHNPLIEEWIFYQKIYVEAMKQMRRLFNNGILVSDNVTNSITSEPLRSLITNLVLVLKEYEKLMSCNDLVGAPGLDWREMCKEFAEEIILSIQTFESRETCDVQNERGQENQRRVNEQIEHQQPRSVATTEDPSSIRITTRSKSKEFNPSSTEDRSSRGIATRSKYQESYPPTCEDHSSDGITISGKYQEPNLPSTEDRSFQGDTTRIRCQKSQLPTTEDRSYQGVTTRSRSQESNLSLAEDSTIRRAYQHSNRLQDRSSKVSATRKAKGPITMSTSLILEPQLNENRKSVMSQLNDIRIKMNQFKTEKRKQLELTRRKKAILNKRELEVKMRKNAILELKKKTAILDNRIEHFAQKEAELQSLLNTTRPNQRV